MSKRGDGKVVNHEGQTVIDVSNQFGMFNNTNNAIKASEKLLSFEDQAKLFIEHDPLSKDQATGK